MAKSSNTLTININGNASGLEQATQQATREIEKLGDEAKRTNQNTDKLPDIDKKMKFSNIMQATDQLSGVGTKIIDLGMNAIRSAGEAQAMDAQFSQVFGNMSGKAQNTINQMAESFGMLPNRIKPLYTSLTSMFKGLGMSQTEAMQEAERATRIASDAAAFYDMSLEDASSAMTSFIKGNYEGGESIGLFANDTQMSAYALKNGLIPATEGAKEASEEALLGMEKAQAKLSEAIKKHGENSIEAREASLKLKKAQAEIDEELGPQAQKWADLDEKTKQAVRLEYAENMQKQAGAIGQASREADGLENQMGNAEQVMKDFYAQIGRDILPTFIDVLKSGVEIIQNLAEAWGKLDKPMKVFIGSMAGIVAVITVLAPPITALVGLAGILGTSLLPLIGIIAGISAVIAIVIGVMENWGDITKGFSKLWESFTKWLDESWKDMKEGASKVWEGVKEKWGEFTNGVKELWNGVKEWFSDLWKGITEGASNIWEGVKEKWQSFVDWVSNIWEGVKEVWSIIWVDIVGIVQIPWELIKALIQTAFNIISGIFDVGGQLLKTAWDMIWVPIRDKATEIWNGITTFLSDTWTAITTKVHEIFDPIAEWFSQLWSGISAKAQEIWNSLTTWFSDTWNGIANTASQIWDLVKSNIINKIQDVKNRVLEIWNGITTWLSDKWNGIANTASQLWNMVKSTIINKVQDVKSRITEIWNGIATWISDKWNGIKNTANNLWSGIKDTIARWVKAGSDSISSGWNGLKETVGNIFNGVKDRISNVWEGVKDVVMKPINWVRDKINGIFDNLNIRIPHIPLPKFDLVGSFNPLKGQIPKLSVTWHAKGGVFTKPTLLGDGSHGVGEAGAEAVLPLKDSVLSKIGNQILKASTYKPDNNQTMVNNISLTLNVEGSVDETNVNDLTTKVIDGVTDLQNRQKLAWS